MDAIFLRNLCRLIISCALVLCSNQMLAQNFTWVASDSAWKGVNGNNWTLRARTGIVTDSGRYFLTDYYVNDKIKGYLEYLPNNYDVNSTTKYPVIIYFPGCGEIHNGKLYLHGPNGTPNYYYGIGRFFAEGNPPPVDIRINAGGASQNYNGEKWWTESISEFANIFAGTASTTYSTTDPISNNGGKEALFQSGRSGTSFGYDLPARDAGQYLLKLYFAETSLTVPGNVFNVTAEGNTILSNFDIVTAAGGANTGYVYQTTVTVNDGKLDLDFSATGGNTAKISAIELSWNSPVSAKDGFESLPTYLRDQGQYFSNIPLKTLGQNYPASGGPKQGVIVLCMMQSGEPVLCGQTSSVVGNPDVQAALDLAFRKYRVDPTRVYLTGMSAGGGVSYSFPGASLTNARTLAAVAPIAAVNTILGNTTEGSNIINGGTAVLAVANTNDFNTNGSGANAYDNNVQAINNLNSFTPIVPRQVTFYTYTNDWQVYNPSDPNQNPADYPKRNHEGWQRGYRWQNPDWDTRPAVFTDLPASGTLEKYTLYEWFLLNQNLASPLPVLLKEFTATRVNGAVELDWKTSTEINSSYFTLERSVDGQNFSPLAKIDAAGNSVTEKKYQYIDNNLPGSAYVYYRLSQTDKDGKKQIFGIRKVFIGSNGFELKVFPTLTTGTLNVEVQGVTSDPINVRVVDLSGKVLIQQLIAPRVNRVTLNVSRLAKGMYVLQADNSVHRFTTKFIKQ